ncbi:MAG: hypothetical protein IB616_04475 [Methanosarcinales archaeon]|nr:MAG: hypothetical protein IB616_04475 [Methanosarcinales archaeon]
MKRKLVAIIFVVFMLTSSLAILVANWGSDAWEDGSIDSIRGALNMTPQDVSFVRYIDVQKMHNTPLGEASAGAIPPDSLYNAEITEMCVVWFEDGTWVEFHQTATAPRIGSIDFIDYLGHEVLIRDVDGTRVACVLGSPNIYGPLENVKKVLDVMEGNASSAKDDFAILEKARPAEFERLSVEDFADYFYLNFHQLESGRYQSIRIYQNPSVDKVTNVTKLAETAPSRGLTYNIGQDEDCMIVTIIGEFDAVISERF